MKLELAQVCKSFNKAIERDFGARRSTTPQNAREWGILCHEIHSRYYKFILGYADENGSDYSPQDRVVKALHIRNLLAEHMSEMTGNPAIRLWLLKHNHWEKIVWDMYDLIDGKLYNKILLAWSCAASAHYMKYFHDLFINSFGEKEGKEMYEKLDTNIRSCFKQSLPYWRETL